MILLENVKKIYNQRIVLDIPHFKIQAGERYALIGANGSGKSSFLKLLAGVFPPDSGKIEFSVKLSNGDLAYMPQKLYGFSFSVLHNVELAIRKSVPPVMRKAVARKALSAVGLEEFQEASGNALSGGETQRMCLARVIAEMRQLILLDEPSSATDVAGSDLIESCLSAYMDEYRPTFVFSTHQPQQALRMADKILFFDKGQLCEHGSAEALLNHPQTAELQQFLSHWRL